MAKLKLGVVTDALMIGGGAIVGNKLASLKLPISLPPIVQPMLPLAVGILLSTRKQKPLQMLGYGMMASGVVGVAKVALPQLGLGRLVENGVGDYVIEAAPDDDGMNGPLALSGLDYGNGVNGVALAGVPSRDDAMNYDRMMAA